MSGIDKANWLEELMAKGWTVPQNPKSDYHLVPPPSLWENRPDQFYVADALELESILAPESDDAIDG